MTNRPPCSENCSPPGSEWPRQSPRTRWSQTAPPSWRPHRPGTRSCARHSWPIRGEYCHHETSFPPITAQLSPGHNVGVQRLGRELVVLHAAPQPRQHRRRVPHRHLALPLAAQQPEWKSVTIVRFCKRWCNSEHSPSEFKSPYRFVLLCSVIFQYFMEIKVFID